MDPWATRKRPDNLPQITLRVKVQHHMHGGGRVSLFFWLVFFCICKAIKNWTVGTSLILGGVTRIGKYMLRSRKVGVERERGTCIKVLSCASLCIYDLGSDLCRYGWA